MKIQYKYTSTTDGVLTVYSRTVLTPWQWHRIARYNHEETPEDVFQDFLKGAPEYSSLSKDVKYWWDYIKYFFRTLKPYTWDSVPGTTYRKVSDIFKKLPLKVSFNKETPDLQNIDDRSLKWYNFVHLYVSDVDWKYKWHSYRFIAPPCVALTFFGKWTLWFQRTAGCVDMLYWEDILEYLYNNMPRENIGKTVLKSYHTEVEDIYTIDNYLK